MKVLNGLVYRVIRRRINHLVQLLVHMRLDLLVAEGPREEEGLLDGTALEGLIQILHIWIPVSLSDLEDIWLAAEDGTRRNHQFRRSTEQTVSLPIQSNVDAAIFEQQMVVSSSTDE